MNRAARMREEGDKSRGIIVGFALAGLQRRLASSPAAIYHSLRRGRDRLEEQAAELRRLAASGKPVSVIDLPKGVKIADLEDFDFDDYGDEEREDLEDIVIDAATAAGTADELETEVAELKQLVKLADGVRRSGVDTKWLELRDLLRSDRFAASAPSDSLDAAPDVDGDSEPVRKLIVFSEHKDTLDYGGRADRGRIGTARGGGQDPRRWGDIRHQTARSLVFCPEFCTLRAWLLITRTPHPQVRSPTYAAS